MRPDRLPEMDDPAVVLTTAGRQWSIVPREPVLRAPAMSNPVEDRKDVLIIDDEAGIRDVLLELLSEGHRCKAAGSAEEALAILSTEKFELILSDIRMGGMSGLEMIPKVLELAPDAVVVMISGESTIESAIEALRVGAFDYIRKPFDLQHVEAAVRRAVDHHSLRAMKRDYENHLEELVTQRTAERDYLSYHDGLTALPNRVLFEDRLAFQPQSSARRGRCALIAASRLVTEVTEILLAGWETYS